jgi:tripartite ATP-independent transporter DctM subunit
MIWFLPMMVMVLLSIPVAFSLGLAGFFGIVVNLNWTAACAFVKTILYGAMESYALSCVPMFILMGELAYQAGISEDLFNAASKWLGRMRGGMLLATNYGCALFGACSGSTIASASIFTRIALPQMLEKGYSKRLASGCIVAAGALACMIPPSILMILYGLITSQPINKLLVGGIVPGALTALAYGIGIQAAAKFRPHMVPPPDSEKISLREKLVALKGILPLCFLILLVLGGLFLGWFTSTAAGAIGSAGAIVVLILRGRFSLRVFYQALLQAGMLSCSLLIIITFGNLFSFVLSSSGAIDTFAKFVVGLEMPPLVVLLMILLLYVVIGCMIDPVSMLIITLPAVMPIVAAYQWDPVWFGLLVITMCEISVITPPVGMNVYTVKAVAGPCVTTSEVFAGACYFLVWQAVVMAIIIAFPEIVTFVPNLMEAR